MKRLIDRFATWFTDAFGTEMSFALWTAGLVVWLALIPVLGPGRWNATIGLGGNTVESTVELFLAIATLIRANQVLAEAKRQNGHVEDVKRHLGVGE